MSVRDPVVGFVSTHGPYDPRVLDQARRGSYEQRDTLRRYLIERAEELRASTSTPARDAELGQLDGWIRWLRAAI